MPPATGNSDPRDTPAMRQYSRFKKRHPDCLLLFRIGDFYEMFDDDAVRASKAIGLTLTQRTAGIPMAGVPYHQLENYLRKFLAAGFRVAVCEQTQDAAEAKGIVERAVTRVLTPGTLVDESLLEEGSANAIAAVCFPAGGAAPAANGRGGDHAPALAAVAIAELSTGAFTVLACDAGAVQDELARRQVTEVLYPETADGKPPPRVQGFLRALGLAGTARPQWQFRIADAGSALREQFGVATLAGFGLGDQDAVVAAAGALVRYLRQTQMPGAEDVGSGSGDAAAGAGASRGLAHLRPPRREEAGGHLLMEAVTLRSLEIDRTIRGSAAEGSLLGVFNAGVGRGSCRTPMGKRLLRDWLCRPSAQSDEVERRHAAVGALVEDRRLAAEAGEALSGVQDVPRIMARVALARATPRDLVALGQSLARCAGLEAALANVAALSGLRGRLGAVREGVEPVAAAIAAACVEQPPPHLREGGLIKDGYDAALDEARTLRTRAGEWCAAYQQRLIAEHDLSSLKVGYNKVFGYYIELPKAQAARAPAAFSRRQTLTGAERYITPELKTFEDDVTSATTRALQREHAIFSHLCERAAKAAEAASAFATAAAELDVVLAFSDKAAARRWSRPVMVEEPVLRIRQGRHPVLDEILGTNFVPNDVEVGGRAAGTQETSVDGAGAGDGLEAAAARLALITGPNMAGKSTFIRQTALLVVLAQAGSFVPAESATIGVVDRVFARVGADDALHAGQSTFMVEMVETAGILHHATARSLVVLDEIGRGTSTLDGLSLAWAIAERLAAGAAPRTLFATHYHELTQLEELLPGRVRNLHVSVKEWGDQIVFLHRILPGRTNQSYGLHVARLAGVPEATVTRAREVLAALSIDHGGLGRAGGAAGGAQAPAAPGDGQLALFREYMPHPAVDALREVKIETLSPLEAFDHLRRLKAMTENP